MGSRLPAHTSGIFLSIRRLFTVIACAEISNPISPDTTYPTTYVDTHRFNNRLDELVRSGHLNEARDLFDKMLHRNEMSRTIMMYGYVNSNIRSSEALAFFSSLWVDPTVPMDPYTVTLALKACGLNMNIRFGESLHAYSVKNGFLNSVIFGSALLDMYCKANKIFDGCADRMFDEMSVKNVVTWTAIITGLVHSGYNKEGLIYFAQMSRSNVHYDSYTYTIALKACANSGALDFGMAIHAQTVKVGLNANLYVANTIAALYNKCGKSSYSLSVIENVERNTAIFWNTIITSYVKTHQEMLAIEKFKRMQEAGVNPNEYTFAAIITGCINLSRRDWGEQLHCHVLRIGLMDSLCIANSIMYMYAKCGKPTSASTVFHRIINKDIVSWNSLISGYSQRGCSEEAFELFSWMRREGEKADEFAMSSLLSASGNMAILEQGKQLHTLAIYSGLDTSPVIRSALVNMYSKCGSIEDASRIFDTGKNDDIVIWTAMINGYAEHGWSHRAIDLFNMIPSVGLSPDSVTFICVLSACSHAGLVDLGFHYFNTMHQKHQITPSQDHYACMVDLLSRAGQIADALHMIKSMPYECNDVILSSLLKACWIHGDFDCGISVAQRVLDVKPNYDWAHIILANMYSLKGRWREAEDIREVWRSKGSLKEPGWSWIKIKDQVFAFVAGDRSHALAENIYNMLSLIQASSRTQLCDNALPMAFVSSL